MRADVATELRTDKHAPRPHKADMPRAEPKSPAPSRPPLNKSPANAPGNKTAPKHKARGSHAMVDNEGEDGATPLFVTGQLHLTADERARRSSAGNRKKPKMKTAEPSRTVIRRAWLLQADRADPARGLHRREHHSFPSWPTSWR